MEAIQNYLESMFYRLPNTPEVVRAKQELLQMMEDKYTELKEEGKTENEAVGTVISEFGNLDELAEELGIHVYVNPYSQSQKGDRTGAESDFSRRQGKRDTEDRYGENRYEEEQYEEMPCRIVTKDEAEAFLKRGKRTSYMIATGVLLCIISPIFLILVEDVLGAGEMIGIVMLFVCIAAAIAIFILSGFQQSGYDFIQKGSSSLSFEAIEFVRREKEEFRIVYAIQLIGGVSLCVLSVLIPIIFDALFEKDSLLSEISVIPFLLVVAIGVFFLVAAGCMMGEYNKLMTLKEKNDREASGQHSTLQEAMAVYWPTVTFLYLAWSFLTFNWHYTWIIWPVASILAKIIRNIVGNEKDK